MWVLPKSDVDPLTDDEDQVDYKQMAERKRQQARDKRDKERLEEEKLLKDLCNNIVF